MGPPAGGFVGTDSRGTRQIETDRRPIPQSPTIPPTGKCDRKQPMSKTSGPTPGDRADGTESVPAAKDGVTRRTAFMALAAPALLQAESAVAATQTTMNFRATFAEAIADFPVGAYFSCAATGELRLYKRLPLPPYYADQGDGAAPLVKSSLGSTAPGRGASMARMEDGGNAQDAIAAAATPAALIASTKLLAPGSTIRTADGHAYRVEPPDEPGWHITTAGGAKLTPLATGGRIMMDAYGSWGNGATDPAQFGAALKHASDQRATLVGGAHLALTLPSATLYPAIAYLDLQGDGMTVNLTTTSGRALNIHNHWHYLVTALTAPAVAKDPYVELAHVAGIAPGDIILIRSNQIWNPQRPTEFFVTNWMQVERVVGNRVYLDEPLYNDFDTGRYTVAVELTRPVRGRGISDTTFVGTGAPGVQGVQILGGIGVEFARCEIRDSPIDGLVLGLCIESGFDRCRAFGCNDKTLGYGLYANTLKRGYNRLGYGKGNRHSHEVGGASEDVVLTRPVAVDDISAGVASHGNTRRVIFDSPVINNCAAGLISRGIAATIINPRIEGAGSLLTIGESNGTNRRGLAGIGTTVTNPILISRGATLAIYVPTTAQDLTITGVVAEGAFSKSIILINGDRVQTTLLRDIDLSKASAPLTGTASGIGIAPLSPDSVDITIEGVRQASARFGVRVVGAGTRKRSRVRLRNIEARGNADRPLYIEGSFDFIHIDGLFSVGNGSANPIRPNNADVTTYHDANIVGGTMQQQPALR